jgi:hypothetical protein
VGLGSSSYGPEALTVLMPLGIAGLFTIGGVMIPMPVPATIPGSNKREW